MLFELFPKCNNFISGTVLAARFDHKGRYQQNHFPKLVNTRSPRSIEAESKYVLIFPEFSLSEKSRNQNERKFALHPGNIV